MGRNTLLAAAENGGTVIGDRFGIGTLVPGKLADLQVLAQDPLQSFDALGKPELVMIGGRPPAGGGCSMSSTPNRRSLPAGAR